MKLIRQYILRAMTQAGESTSLGNLPAYPSEAKALEAITSGEVTLPNGCHAHIVPVHTPVPDDETPAVAATKKATTKPATKPAEAAKATEGGTGNE
jgi:hypothetical protein